MSISIALNSATINALDLSPVETFVTKQIAEGMLASYEQQVSFEINYSREEDDPRELSEIPEIRLWFVRLDARYPWFFFLLDGKSGEIYRYTAMLVPHQFNRTEGIQYNPEALEIFVMNKMFVLSDWLKQQGISSATKLKALAQMLGYDLDESFFTLLD
ncbi:CRR6 family NdhI maturation factor [Oscillatoria sp. FACHB-1406]|uniref:CRR6 family NdhI maturation factor n=1 Tax=Oscillatoria sp. FACHB-1406 TaxID=2692846 RepID=UPI001685A625|nr:CRR6 family NdhI maturation factor [Oscillatoria sp. FACHB-1406]MBD2576526.1 CRR6 family NdhI maturation factor [Oscillatoria sp. FACHB-1406]